MFIDEIQRLCVVKNHCKRLFAYVRLDKKTMRVGYRVKLMGALRSTVWKEKIWSAIGVMKKENK